MLWPMSPVFPVEVPALSSVSGDYDWSFQSTGRHQRDSVLPEQYFCFGRIFVVVGRLAGRSLIGATNLLFTAIGMTLGSDRLGRKTLLLIGAAGCASCLAGVAYVFLSKSHQASLLWLLIVYIAFFAVSQGAVIWVYIGEVFPNVVRNKGQSVGNSSHWIMNAAIALIFPILAAKSGGAPFVFFAVMTARCTVCGGAVPVLSRDQGADARGAAAQIS